MSFRTCVILLLLQTGLVQCIFKRWKPNTNFETPENWNVGRVPCGSDVVKFINGDHLSPSVFIQTNVTMKEFWLPMNGELIFGANSILSFTDSAQNNPDCPDAQGELEFIRGPKDWLNPSSWCHTPTETGSCQNPPLLESEMVPGLYDDVIFPLDKTFFVSLGVSQNYQIKSLKISGTSLTTSSFSTFVKSADGTRMFPPPQLGAGTMSTITITRTKCNSPKAGCPNGNDQPSILSQICDVFGDQCDRSRCKSPLKPLGGCCNMCGGLMNVTIDNGFNLTEFKQLLQSQFTSKQKDVELIVSRLSIMEDLVQVVVRDKTGEKSVSVAQTMKQDMDKDVADGGFKYGIKGISLAVSGSSSQHGNTSAHTGGMSGGEISGLVIGLMIFIPLAVIILIFLWSVKTKRTNVVTNMVDGLKGKVDSLRRKDGDKEILTEMGTFENRMYGTPLDDMNIQDFNMSLSETQPSALNSGGFDNPLYGNPAEASGSK